MLGKSHAIIGASGFVIAGSATATLVGVSISPGQLACGTAIAAGAALLPDLDHPEATVSHAFGPISWMASKVIRAVSGGHRNGTHSLLGIAAATAASVAIATFGGVWGVFALAFICVGLAVQIFADHAPLPVKLLITVTAAGGMTVLGASAVWIPLAVGLGYALHIAADFVTKEGIPLLWPLPARQKLGLIRTGGTMEKVIAYGIGGVGILAAISTIA